MKMWILSLVGFHVHRNEFAELLRFRNLKNSINFYNRTAVGRHFIGSNGKAKKNTILNFEAIWKNDISKCKA